MSRALKGILTIASTSFIGCAAVCPILNMAADAAKETCPIIVEYIDKDGKTQKVQIPRDQMMGAVRQSAKKAGLPLPQGSASVHVDAVTSASVSSSAK